MHYYLYVFISAYKNQIKSNQAARAGPGTQYNQWGTYVKKYKNTFLKNAFLIFILGGRVLQPGFQTRIRIHTDPYQSVSFGQIRIHETLDDMDPDLAAKPTQIWGKYFFFSQKYCISKYVSCINTKPNLVIKNHYYNAKNIEFVRVLK